MKLFRFYVGDEAHIGADIGNGIVDITEYGYFRSMYDIVSIEEALQCATYHALDKTFPTLEEGSLRHAPLLDPGKVLCVGLNYRKHAAECGLEEPKHPVFFSKFGDAVCASGDDIPLPSFMEKFDHECELVIVMGKEAVEVSTDEAEECIFGYTCGNDFSARDGQFVTSQWLPGKSGYRFGPIGPCIVTRDSFDPEEPVKISCSVNGVKYQDGEVNDMIFGCRELVSVASRYFRLMPGDVIFTGTPSGVIHGANGARPWLKAGDEMKVTIDGIGSLTNRLVKRR